MIDAAAFTVIDNPSRDDVHALGDRLYEFNIAASGIGDGRELAIFVRGDDGRVVAGLYGWTWGGCAFIDRLWDSKHLHFHVNGGEPLR